MRLVDQVCSLELAKQLYAVGVPQDSVWLWCQEPDALWHLYIEQSRSRNIVEWYSAFTVAELGRMLPQSLDWELTQDPADKGKRFDLVIENPRSSCDGWRVAYHWWNLATLKPASVALEGWSQTEADCRAWMVIQLQARGLLK